MCAKGAENAKLSTGKSEFKVRLEPSPCFLGLNFGPRKRDIGLINLFLGCKIYSPFSK